MNYLFCKIDFIYDVSDFILFSSNNCTDKKLNTKTFRNLEILFRQCQIMSFGLKLFLKNR